MKTYLTPLHSNIRIRRSVLFVFLLAISLLSSKSLKASDYFWVGGTGNWSDYAAHWATTSGGTIFHTTIPTINDDVYFDSNSFPAANSFVTLDNTFIYCRNMDWSGSTFNPELDGLNSTLNVNGSLRFINAMTVVVKRIDFISQNPGNTINPDGIPLDTLYITGAGAYSLTADLNCKSIFIENGTFNTNNFNINAEKFGAGVVNATVNVDLGSSTITCSEEFKAYYGTINMSSSQADLVFSTNPFQSRYFWTSGLTFHDITFLTSGQVIGSFICNKLTASSYFYINSYFTSSSCHVAEFSGSAKLDCDFTADSLSVLTPGSNLQVRQLTINDYLKADGVCGQPIQIFPIEFLASAGITKTSGSVTVDYTIITSIQAGGGAVFTANNSVDAGNNSGWIINNSLPRTLYWVGGTGNWEDESHWSLSSGGAGGNCIPSSLDNVFFDGSSFSQTGQIVTVTNSPAICNNIDWTGAGFSPTFTSVNGYGTLKVFGSVTLAPSMIFQNSIECSGTTSGNTIFSAGNYIPGINISATGSWTLADELHCDAVSVYEGTFSSGSFDIYAKVFSANGNNSSIFVDLGSSTLYLSERLIAFSSSLSISSSTANLVFNNTSGTLIENQLFDASFKDVTCVSGCYFSGKLNCRNFDAQSGVFIEGLDAAYAEFNQNSSASSIEADTLILQSGVSEFTFDSLTIISQFNANSSCSHTLRLNHYNPFLSQAIITKASGTFVVDYAFINNIGTVGGATFTANNSWDLGNNSGWTINTAASRNLYWVGGSGAWSDNSHWALASGGSGGNCQPGSQDNVRFDANSFSVAGDTVFVTPALGVYCNNLDFSGVPAGSVLYSNGGSNVSYMNVRGSVNFPPALQALNVVLNMTSSSPGQTITSGGNTLNGLSITGSGSWTLQDPLTMYNFQAGNGTFISNGYDINVSGINAGGSAVLDFGTSTITTMGMWANSSPNLTILGSNANLIITSSFLSFEVNNVNFNSITFTGKANTVGNFSCNYLYGLGEFTNANSDITAGRAEFKSNVTLTHPFIGDTIVFDNPGDLVLFSQITVNDNLIANGTSGFPIQIEGLNGSGTLQKSSGQICLDNMLVRNVTATGGAQFFAGNNSVDLGGNSGWAFTSCVPPVTDVWPGDANYDLTADNNDILNIGLAYGYTGPVRAGASLNWVAQPATDWAAQFANGANLKHADTDGSGVVNSDDTTAVSLNYGLIHPFRLQNPNTFQMPAPVLYVTTNPDTANTSDTVQVSIFLGTSTLPVDSIYGIAFTINLDTALVNTSYLDADFSNCWLGTQQVDLLAFNKNLMTEGRVDVALVRTDQNNTNGFGYLGRLGIVIVDNVGAKITLPVTISNITAITAGEYHIPIAFQNDSVVIDTTTSVGLQEQLAANSMISLYPNPADQIVQVNSGDVGINSYNIFNQFGVQIKSEEVHSNRFRINTTVLKQGLYTIQFLTDKGAFTRKFLVVRK